MLARHPLGPYRLRYCLNIIRFMRGVHERFCPCCGYQGRLHAFGYPPRFDAECPRCGSWERHRLFALVNAEHRLVQGKAVLHFAPEPCLMPTLREQAASYTTADLSMPGVDRKLDLEAIAVESASYDVVIASHVLEHVDDRKAMPELHRILKPGGSLVTMVPLVEGWARTYENAGVTTPELRTLHFGQHDHVRMYGRDFRDRLTAAGFRITEHTAEEPAVSKHALLRGEKVFVCAKTR